MDEFEWNHLDAVYIRLGLEVKDIRNERRGTPDPRGQERQILHLWRNMANEGATRERMIAAMEQVPECGTSLNRLKERWNINCSPGEYDIRDNKSIGTFLIKLVPSHIQQLHKCSVNRALLIRYD